MRIPSYLQFAIACFTASFLHAVDADKAGPRIQFAETVYDFGKVKGGEVVKHSFVFTNTGSATLEIIEVKPGCGCTTAGTWDKMIEPGKTGSIPLQFNSAGFGGAVSKSATVKCNDAARSNVVLQLNGTVWKPIDLTPATAFFNFPAEGQTNETKVIRIVSNIEEPVTLAEPINTNQSFRIELKTTKPGKEFELRVTAIAPFTASYTGIPIQIKTSSKEMPEISTSAYVTVLPVVSAFPQQITLPASPLATESHSNVTLRNNTTNNIVLSDPTVNVPGAKVSIRESQPGRVYALSLDLPAGFETPGQRMEVTVKSSYAKFPLIKIPVFQPQGTPVKAVAK